MLETLFDPTSRLLDDLYCFKGKEVDQLGMRITVQ